MMVCLLFAIGLVCCSCGGTDPVQACQDFVEAGASSLSNCWEDIDRARSEIEEQLGGCSDTKSIRNESELYADCIPELRGWTCAQWAAGLPAACLQQIEK